MIKSIYCPFCHRHTSLTIAKDGNGYKCVTGTNHGTHWIGLCNYCERAVLVNEGSGAVYPHPLPSPTDENVPKLLATDLNEAKMAMSIGCFRASATMSRRCIQQACIDKGAKSDKLVEQIKELTAAGTITKDIEEWASVVRWVGNDAAHPGGQEVTKEDADDCLKLAEQFLHVIYVTPALAKARRAARGK